VALRFTVIMDDLETIEGMGIVVRVCPPGGAEPAGMGVVFTELGPFTSSTTRDTRAEIQRRAR
jgi:hypothetical protein